MRISTVSGHLTATNKRHLASMFRQGIKSAQSAKLRYYVHSLGLDTYRVEVVSREYSAISGRVVNVSNVAEFRVTY